MSLSLATEVEERLKTEASRKGVTPEQYATEVLDEHLAQAERERRAKAIALLQSWIAEAEHTNESAELDEEFFRNLEENRVRFREVTLPD